MDKIVQGNTSNIIFLKSTDDSMIDTLVKMSGQTHEVHKDSVTVTKDAERILLPNEGKISETVSIQQTNVLKYNDFAFLPERNSIVFRAGDMPILNRNETVLPMSWKLLGNTIIHPGHNYSLQTIPTLSSALEFDVRQNQPDFQKMLEKRMQQAFAADDAKEIYQEAYGYTDYEISQLDIDTYADEIMEIIDRYLENVKLLEESENGGDEDGGYDMDIDAYMMAPEDNDEQRRENAKASAEYERLQGGSYAGGQLNRGDLVSTAGVPTHGFDDEIMSVFREIKGDMFNDRQFFQERNGELYSADGREAYIVRNQNISEDLRRLQQAERDGTLNVYDGSSEDVTKEQLSELNQWIVTDEFYRFLVQFDRWSFAHGRFEQVLDRVLRS